MDKSCSAIDWLRSERPEHDWTGDSAPDFVQVFVDDNCIRPPRTCGAGPGGVHLGPDEGLPEILNWYLPADGRAHSVKLRYTRHGGQGYLAAVPVGDLVKPIDDGPAIQPPSPPQDYVNPQAIAGVALDFATDQGRQAMRATLHADKDRRELANAAVEQAERYADRTVAAVGKAYDRAYQTDADANARIERMTAQAFDLVRVGIEGAEKRADAAERRAEQQRRDSAPMAVAMRALQAGKMVLDMAGGVDGIKEKLSGAVQLAGAVNNGGAAGIADSIVGIGREFVGMYKEVQEQKAALDAVSRSLDVDDDAPDVDVDVDVDDDE